MGTKTGFNIRRALRAFLILALGLMAWPSLAANTTTTFQVQLTLTSGCAVSATDLNFGSAATPIASNIDQVSTISATCTLLTPYTLALDAGTGSGASFATRKMTNGADTVNYSLYTDLLRTTVWGDGTGGSSTTSGNGLGVLPVLHTVYGRVPSGQNVPANSYSDTVTVTLTY